MKRFTFFAITILAAFYALGAVKLGFPGEHAASVGIYIRDLNTGEVIAENDSSRAMLPASIMKSLTTATAISTMDPDFRFSTKVYLTGDVDSTGICSGNLVIESCGDPTIDSEYFPEMTPFSKEIIKAVKSLNITGINGRVIVKETLSQPGCIPEWELGDVAWYYGAGFFGFNFNDNVFKLWPASGRSVPHIPGLKLIKHPASHQSIQRGAGTNTVNVWGPVNNSQWDITCTMSSPADAFAYAVKQSLTDAGISVGDAETASEEKGRIEVCEHLSPSLFDMLHQMMIHSHNMFAEGFLRATAPGKSRTEAIKAERDLWNRRGISSDYIRIVDGSGLARADRLRPNFMADMLTWMAESEFARTYTDLFPRVGQEGTVRKLLKNTYLEGNLALKSGSMTGVQCYAGYKLDEQGLPSHVIVIMINGFYCDRARLRKAIEDFLIETFAQ